MTLKDYINEAVVGKGRVVNKYGITVDDIGPGTYIEEFTSLLDRLGYEEIVVNGLTTPESELTAHEGSYYSVNLWLRNEVRVTIRNKETDCILFRVTFDQETGTIVDETYKIFRYKKRNPEYRPCKSNIKELAKFLK